MKKKKLRQKNCKHIYGLLGGDMHINDLHSPKNVFKYCPLCGKKLKTKQTYKYRVTITPDRYSGYISSVDALKGCISYGNTREEALKNVKDCATLYLKVLEQDGREIPPDIPHPYTNVETIEISL